MKAIPNQSELIVSRIELRDFDVVEHSLKSLTRRYILLDLVQEVGLSR